MTESGVVKITKMLILDKLNKSFDSDPVITNFSYNFENNGIYRLEGPNGIGKTTLSKDDKGHCNPRSRVYYPELWDVS